ncbi:MAG: sigma-70 family RNA polymerase sigma factor, partial [Planctomycetia bacterium]|nr:sigma-70 family RNA polymerase sigma factor [Planctomycetia bacterium]
MSTAQLGTIRKVFDRVRAEADHGDGELLTRYRTLRDQDAFGSLVRRHGPMVLGVCKRVLRDSHAADDAFQATFLVLAKKADAVRPPDRLAPWLYGVAYRTALKARGRAFRRQQVEQAYAAESANRPAPSSDEFADVLPILDEQVNGLPEKYRTPLVLCAIQGLNKAEAAARLGLPEGTVSSRLARAREMLRERLTRRGLVVPAVALGGLLTADSLQAAVPPALAASASEVALGTALVPTTVLTLSHEVLRSMTLLKLKTLYVIALSVTLAGGGFGFYALSANQKKPAGEKPTPTKPVGEKP